MTRTRIITGIAILLVLLPLMYIGGIPFQLLGFVMAGLAANEMFNMYKEEKEFSVISRIFMIVTTLAIYSSVALITVGDDIVSSIGSVTVSVMIIVTAMSLLLFVASEELTGEDVSKFSFVSLYIGLGFGTIVFLRNINLALIIYAIIISFMADIFAYVFGRLFGKHKMSPVISPKKTWEGFAGGLFVSVLVATLFAYNYGTIFDASEKTMLQIVFGDVTSLSDTTYLLLTIFISISLVVISVVGDLAASKLKRHYGIKDFANYMPGHGGFMDRFDSTILVCLTFVGLLLAVANLV